MKRSLAVLLAAATLTSPLFAAEISIHGSTTMTDLNKRLATDYESTHPGSKVRVLTSDSGQGIADLIAGTASIAASSRAIRPDESAKMKAVGLPIARDGIAIYVHPGNPVDSLTEAELTGIFAGKITNWKEVHGVDAPIAVYVRENGSGTAEFFKEHVLGGKNAAYPTGARELQSTAAVIAAVASNRFAIGYAGAAVTKAAKVLPLRKTAGSPAISPTREAVLRGVYPLARILYYYVSGTPQGDLLEFTQWVLSPRGQQTVTQAGYFAVK